MRYINSNVNRETIKCPFCYGKARCQREEISNPITMKKKIRYKVKCKRCGASTDLYRFPDDAYAAWEKRS